MVSLKLYLFTHVFNKFTGGMAFAVAASKKEAINILVSLFKGVEEQIPNEDNKPELIVEDTWDNNSDDEDDSEPINRTLFVDRNNPKVIPPPENIESPDQFREELVKGRCQVFPLDDKYGYYHLGYKF